MATIDQLIHELEVVIEHTTAARYTIVSSLCLYVYDYFVTLPAEVEHFWGSRRSLVKFMFFWNRYFTFPVVAYLTFSEINRLPNTSLCLAGQAVGIILSIFCIAGAQVIMQLRVHALYGHHRRLKITLSCLFAIAVSSELGIAIAKLATDNSTVQPLPFLVDPLSLCVGPVPKFLLIYPVPMMIFDSILLILVVYKSYLTQREESARALATSSESQMWIGARLIKIMFRDSVIYFACTVGVNLFNLVMWAAGPFDLFTMGTAWASTVPVMAASRILFNMRKAYNQPVDGVSSIMISQGTEFQVARRPLGSTGQTVWSQSSGTDSI
ncbi:hypothetical protein C8F01DRAFT_122664 [Mycena amicta]|nr:hypothetical protein C8F01DRAFT_122664 [Mycena amicta]